MKKGVLTVVSGFSGAGKGTVTRELVKRYDNYSLSISATSRAPREGEEEGKHYFFKSREEFESMIAADAFIEHAMYVGEHYGTPKAYVEECLAQGRDVLLEIEVQGALQVKEIYPDAVTIFMTTKDIPTLRDRLVGRGTETPEKIAARLARAEEEVLLMDRYDYILVNDDLETCINDLHQLIVSQHMKAGLQADFIEELKNQFDHN